MSVTLVDVQSVASYNGMVPGYLAKCYTSHSETISLPTLCEWAQVDFVHDGVVDVDFKQQLVYTMEHSKAIPYDVVSFDIGSATKGLDDIPGAFEYTIPTRPVSELIQRVEMVDSEIALAQEKGTFVHVVVVGGGAAGIELSMSLVGRWTPILGRDLLQVTIVTSEQILLSEPQVTVEGHKILEKIFQEHNIDICFGAHVTAVESSCVLLENGLRIPFTHCVLATGAGCHDLASIMEQRGLAMTADGWIKVNEFLQSESHPNVFAAGDCCSMPLSTTKCNLSLHKNGVHAIRAGPVLARNLQLYLFDPTSKLGPYHPDDDFLKLIGCGDGTALGFQYGIVMRGKWVWQLKDSLDRKFVDMFRPPKKQPSDKSLPQPSQDEDVDLPRNEPPIPPREAANLLRRTDQNVDYQQAAIVLQHMASYSSYRAKILECFEETQKDEEDTTSCNYSSVPEVKAASS